MPIPFLSIVSPGLSTAESQFVLCGSFLIDIFLPAFQTAQYFYDQQSAISQPSLPRFSTTPFRIPTQQKKSSTTSMLILIYYS